MMLYIILIIFTSLISYQAFNNPNMLSKLMHYPYDEYRNNTYYRWLTSGFVHANMTHLLVNMLVLYFFGGYVETYFDDKFGMPGKFFFLLFYCVIIVLANIPTYLKNRNNQYFSSVGASGAISGLLYFFILHEPLSKLYFYFVLPIPAWLFGILYLIYSSYMSKQNADRIDHDAHFMGAVTGLVLGIMIDPSSVGDFISQISNIF
ncbi:MAG TPA: rhomboid family intramembrane serine protease [Saprospiraceae bacterium]|nr:rhomboid family intramembrane serine protease [Saprospiraceae bacterium]MCB9329241.1 rhomboid family intramembrane serine protease [Lewinellaceae bacterium]HPK10728.1 rhomboid family intramembrane serine protease [Saprospiraceae bacterium]HRX28215.1 rhomboid family intramembrane serine protease [Saprospiraceae bacterium]